MTKAEKMYTDDFYSRQSADSFASARACLTELFSFISPRSVVDIGCGVGTWLRAAEELGVKDILGIDGHNVDPSTMQIDVSRYKKFDLATGTPNLDRRFELAMSLEVGEHLHSSRADEFVRLIAGAADVALFSAAIPGQGGRHHVNEQFPSYWIRKFSVHGFRCFDLLRPTLWNRDDVAVWYRQNIVVFARNLSLPGELPSPEAFDRVHPLVWSDPKLVQRRIRRKIRDKLRSFYFKD